MIVVCFACAPQAMAGPLIGISGDFLYDIDTTTGLASNPRQTGGAAIDIAFGDGLLYGTRLFSLSTINPATGEAFLLGEITGIDILETIQDLAWDPEDGVLSALVHLGGTTSRRLYTIDRTSLIATVVGQFDANYTTMSFDPQGRLFAIDRFANSLGMIDKNTAATIWAISLSPDIFSRGSMSFTDSGELFADTLLDDGRLALLAIDPTDASVVSIGGTGLSVGFNSLAYIPEPSTCCFVLFGVLGFLMRRGACRPGGLMLEPSGKSVYDMMPCRGQSTFFRGIRIISKRRGT